MNDRLNYVVGTYVINILISINPPRPPSCLWGVCTYIKGSLQRDLWCKGRGKGHLIAIQCFSGALNTYLLAQC